MEEFPIGKEIKEELSHQKLSVDDLAEKLKMELQTVNDMLESNHISVNILMEVSRYLRRNFFRELSVAYMSGTDEDSLSSLAPEEKLHIVPKNSEVVNTFN